MSLMVNEALKYGGIVVFGFAVAELESVRWGLRSETEYSESVQHGPDRNEALH